MAEEIKEKKEITKKEAAPKIGADLEIKKDQINEKDEDSDDSDDFLENKIGMNETEELPDEIKKKLEKRKSERTKKKVSKKKKKTEKKNIKMGHAYVKATYNNTIITLTDVNGNVISWASAGMAGFKGAKKSTPYAAQIITKIAVTTAREEYGLQEVNVFVNGVGTGRESAVRALNANGLDVLSIKDITPIPHNGCRPRKPRRV